MCINLKKVKRLLSVIVWSIYWLYICYSEKMKKYNGKLVNLSFRSVLTYSRIGGHVKTLTFCQGSHYLAVGSDNGSIQLLAVEAHKPPKSPKVQPCQTRQVILTIIVAVQVYNSSYRTHRINDKYVLSQHL